MQLLLHWMRKWEIDDKMNWKNAAEKQAIFIRDEICTNLLHTHSFVVSTHRSKSIILPVYFFTMRNGIKIICRENFYGWMLTVKLPQDRPYADIIPQDLFECGYKSSSSDCYFEGFRKEWVYEGYDPDDIKQRNFSFGIYSDYEFYTVMYMLKHLYGEVDVTKDMEKLTYKNVVETIEKIYDGFGYNDWEVHTRFGEPRTDRIMSGYEILWRTYHQLDKSDFRKKYGLDYIMMDTTDDPHKFAEYIVKYPEVKEAFAREVRMYNAEI